MKPAAPTKAAAVNVAPAKAPAKQDPFALASIPAQPAPNQAVSQSVSQATSTVTPKAATVPKPAPKLEAAVSTSPKPSRQPEPPAKPDTSAAARAASSKDRAWQSGQLLSVVNNSYFFNVTYTSDSDGSAWPFVQGSDGRFTVNGQIGNPTTSLYTYDNYVIESQFCVYLVQRMRPKTSSPAACPEPRR